MDIYQPQDNLPLRVAEMFGDVQGMEAHKKPTVMLMIPQSIAGRLLSKAKKMFERPDLGTTAIGKSAETIARGRRKERLF